MKNPTRDNCICSQFTADLHSNGTVRIFFECAYYVSGDLELDLPLYTLLLRECMVRECGREESLWFTFVGNRERKRGLELSVGRTPQQEAEENAILEQAATIQAARKAEQAQLLAQRKAAAPPLAGLSQMLIVPFVFTALF